MSQDSRDRDKPQRLVLKIEETTETTFDRSEYEYVIRDLQRVAILALIMFALLFVLAFLMR